MARFDLSQYETVEERHARALAEYPDLRVEIINHTRKADREKGLWVVEARVYKDAGDQAAGLPKATEWAFEIDGEGMANKTSALENACTSSLGRALRWAFAGSKGPSRSEMEKVARHEDRDWIAEAASLEDVKQLRVLWANARQAGADKATLQALEARASELGNSEGGGA